MAVVGWWGRDLSCVRGGGIFALGRENTRKWGIQGWLGRDGLAGWGGKCGVEGVIEVTEGGSVKWRACPGCAAAHHGPKPRCWAGNDTWPRPWHLLNQRVRRLGGEAGLCVWMPMDGAT